MLKKPLRILLIDDDEDDFIITQEIFEEIQYFDTSLDWVDHPDDALKQIQKAEHDLYLLDYHLGSINGLDVLKRALRMGARAPFIMLTGQGGRHVDIKAMESGAYDFLVKGQITPQILERSIRYALQHAKTVEALRSTVKLSSALLGALDKIASAVFIVDTTKTHQPIIYINEPFQSHYGFTRQEALGRSWHSLLDTNGSMQPLREAIMMSEQFSGSFTHGHPDYGAVHFDLNASPVRASNGLVNSFVFIASPQSRAD